MICPMCGCFFCYDNADEGILNENRKAYCSKTCKKGHDKRINRFNSDMRRRPHHYRKEHYGSRYLAELTAESRGWENPYFYRCCHEGWQITKQPKRSKNAIRTT